MCLFACDQILRNAHSLIGLLAIILSVELREDFFIFMRTLDSKSFIEI